MLELRAQRLNGQKKIKNGWSQRGQWLNSERV